MTREKDETRHTTEDIALGQQVEGLSIHTRVIDGSSQVAVVVTGYLDGTTTHSFQRFASQLIENGRTNLIVDLQAVNFVASVGIGAMVALLRSLRSHHGSLVLLGMQPRVLEVFQLLGFANFFEIAVTMSEAVELANAQAAQPVFPRNSQCPICSIRVRLTGSGRFRCPRCRVTLKVDSGAVITL